MTKLETATDVVVEAMESGRDVADVYHEALEQHAMTLPELAREATRRGVDPSVVLAEAMDDPTA